MGKVFTPEEIQAEKVPVEGAHLAAAEIIVDQLLYGDAFEEFLDFPYQYMGLTGIDSGLIHGSVTHDTANIRSDLDVLIIHNASVTQYDTLGVTRDIFGKIKSNLHVPIEANIIELNDARHRNHRIDPLFFRYLTCAEQNPNFSLNFPVTALGIGFRPHMFSPDSLLRVVQRYTGGKIASFAVAQTQESPTDEHRYQRALELPKNLGRKVLSMLNADLNPGEMDGAAIVAQFKDFMIQREPDEKKGSAEQVTELDELDREYTTVLHDTIDGNMSIRSYAGWMEAHRLHTLKLAHSVCLNTQEALLLYERELSAKTTVFNSNLADNEQLEFDIDFDSDY